MYYKIKLQDIKSKEEIILTDCYFRSKPRKSKIYCHGEEIVKVDGKDKKIKRAFRLLEAEKTKVEEPYTAGIRYEICVKFVDNLLSRLEHKEPLWSETIEDAKQTRKEIYGRK